MSKLYFPPPKQQAPSDPYRTPAERPAETRPLAAPRLQRRSPTFACPACHVAMTPRVHATFSTHDCASCRGVFLDAESIRAFASDGDDVAARELLSAYPASHVRELARELGYVKCPVCSNVMNRKQFAPGAKTVVDVCKEHGTFFDEGELARVLDFVLQGGLTRAAEKEREAAREQRQSELSRERYLAGQHPASSFEQRHTDALRNTETFADLLLYVLLG